ncbi:MAG: dTDP-4-dehydrorhamnose 3,5-epimerase family protein [Bacteroidales bacterium]|nr:dTDP-4-dehydrorhamnose 3,5-epimerase family protein [Bacteroidales bacterium]
MEIHPTDISGLMILKNPMFQDIRGGFQKIFTFDEFKKNKLDVDFKEFYYSVSHKDVIRGMHFQTPPCEHSKLVFVNQGSVIDVVVDLRKLSPTYGHYFSIELTDSNGVALYISKGLAHGFCAKMDNTIVNYLQTSVFSKENDAGILYDSFGFDWQVKNPILSERDLAFQSFHHFKTPF